jgi:hypothetical protein
MRAAKKSNGDEYYEYILTYVDNCLIVSQDSGRIISSLEQEYYYELKDVGEPKRYLGTKIGKYSFPDSMSAWYMSARLYLQQAIIEVERQFGNLLKIFKPSTLDVPIQPGSHLELDDTQFLEDDDVQLYQSYIGILRWAVELRQVDLAHVAGAMVKFSAAPRKGHLWIVLRIFAYCKKHNESKILFDPVINDMEHVDWTSQDWAQFYPDIKGEVTPHDQPEPRGKRVQVNMFCDAAHATCHVTCQSTTGIILFINGAPIVWYSNRRNTIETRTFGSEFCGITNRSGNERGTQMQVKNDGHTDNGTDKWVL